MPGSRGGSRRGEDTAVLLRSGADGDTRPPWTPIQAKQPSDAGSAASASADVPPSAWAFATIIQTRFRGARVRRAVHRWLGRAVGVPDLGRARAYARSLLPHDQEGRLLPLSCPIECFTVFGAGVYAYMRWTLLMKRVFFICFLFSAANVRRREAFGARHRCRRPQHV